MTLRYDYSNDKRSVLRKRKAYYAYIKAKKKLIMKLALFTIFLVILRVLPYILTVMDIEDESILKRGFRMSNILWVIIVILAFELTYTLMKLEYYAYRYQTLDVIIDDRGITLPDWDFSTKTQLFLPWGQCLPTKTKLYKWDKIERIYYDKENQKYNFVIRSDNHEESKVIRVPLNIIDNKEEFDKVLRKSGKFSLLY